MKKTEGVESAAENRSSRHESTERVDAPTTVAREIELDVEELEERVAPMPITINEMPSTVRVIDR